MKQLFILSALLFSFFKQTALKAQCSGTVLSLSAANPSTTGTTGSWTVPSGGPYKIRITAKGAQGGNGGSLSAVGLGGATVQGDFIVATGQVLSLVAGAPGGNGANQIQGGSSGGGGGGASGVYVGGTNFLIAAGGGGSAGGQGDNGGDGGGNGLSYNGVRTCGFGPGRGSGFGGGGYGSGATGGLDATGRGNSGGGGGGGYTGGCGGRSSNSGGSGGSFNQGTNQSITTGNSTNGGQITIECLGAAVFSTNISATHPTCGSTQGSLNINLSGDVDGNTSGGVEYAIVSGSTFIGTPTFADINADPFNITSGFGTTAGTYTVRVRLKYNPTIFTDYTYTLTTITGPVTPATTTNNALNFNGTDNTVAISNCGASQPIVNGGNEITIEYWFKGSNIQSAVRFQDGNGYVVAGWATGVHILSNDGGTGGGLSVGAAAMDGNWHHVAMTWKRNTTNGFVSYLDGQIVAQRNSADVPLPTINTTYLGSYNGSSEFMNGSLDEVRVWNIARTQAQIQAGMNDCNFTQVQSGLLAYYKFDHGTANSNNSVNTLGNYANPGVFNGSLQNFALSGTTSNWIQGHSLAPGNPIVFGNNQWNVYAYNSGNGTIGGTDWSTNYAGYYTTSNLNFNTENDWAYNGSPSSATSYQGCSVNVDQMSYAAKRQGFDCGYYSLNIPSHDDAAQLFVNGNKVWEHDGCCDNHTAVWSGWLGANDKIEYRISEGGGGSAARLVFNLIRTGDTSYIPVSICPNQLPYTWNGNSYNNPGIYYAHFSSVNGCDSVEALILKVNEPTTSETTVSICNKYTWNGTVYKASGDYTWTGTNAAGCDSTATLHLTILSVTSTYTKTDVSCFGNNNGSITINPTFGVSPFTYRIGTVGAYGNANTFTNLKPGKYRVSILDVNGCAGISVQVTIVQSSSIGLNITKTNVTCYLKADGTITATGTGGTQPYQYRFGTAGTFSTSNRWTGLAPGVYSVVVKDANGCIANGTVTITQASAPVSASAVVTNESCPNAKNGSITINATGGTAPYKYRFGTTGSFATVNTFSNLKAGNYRVFVNDAGNCTGYSIGVSVGQTSPTCTVSTRSIVVKPDILPVQKGLSVLLSPNPTNSYFTLRVKSILHEAINIRVFEVNGRIVYTTKGLPEQAFKFGDQLPTGVYLVEVRQGETVKTLKAIKIRN